MDEKERMTQLVAMLLELRMANSQSEAENRARAIMASTTAEGPSLSSIASAPMMPAPETQEAPTSFRDSPHLVVMTKQEELSRALSGLNAAPVVEAAHATMPVHEGTTYANLVSFAAPAPAEPESTPELDTAVDELAQISEDETKESINAQELQQQMVQLERELQDSRKEIDMLRQKLAKTEDALAKAATVVQKDDRTLAQPQAREPMPAHQKPRGTNPPVDLSRIFGR